MNNVVKMPLYFHASYKSLSMLKIIMYDIVEIIKLNGIMLYLVPSQQPYFVDITFKRNFNFCHKIGQFMRHVYIHVCVHSYCDCYLRYCYCNKKF